MKLYVLTSMRSLDVHLNLNTRTIGFFETFEDADLTVRECSETINEDNYFKYCIIEEVGFGLYKYGENRWFYKFDSDKMIYELIDEPEKLKCVVGFYE